MKKAYACLSARACRCLAVAMILVIMLTVMFGFSFTSDLQYVARSGTGPPVGTSRIEPPSLLFISNIPEEMIHPNGSYVGTVKTVSGDLVLVQIAYSEGGPGNLPDIAGLIDLQSNAYAKAASASPGPAQNFWEQAWTTISSTTGYTNVTVFPDWLDCQSPCVGSIIISMTIALYQGVSSIGPSASVAMPVSSISQSADLSVTQKHSLIVELLSHGASGNCDGDPPQPRSGQILQNCFTGNTERMEFFDHSVTFAQTYNESFSWADLEVQRGIYLELIGMVLP